MKAVDGSDLAEIIRAELIADGLTCCYGEHMAGDGPETVDVIASVTTAFDRWLSGLGPREPGGEEE